MDCAARVCNTGKLKNKRRSRGWSIINSEVYIGRERIMSSKVYIGRERIMSSKVYIGRERIMSSKVYIGREREVELE